MSNSHERVDLIYRASEYRVLVDEASELIYKYRNGEIPESDCWPKIRERDDKKKELIEAALKVRT